MKTAFSTLLCVALLGATPFAVDARSKDKLSEVKLQPAQFAEYRASVEKELRGGDSLAEMPITARDEVRSILARMDERLAGVSRVEDLPESERVKLFNDQSRLQVLLGQAEADSRLVCRREKTLGSNRTRTVCQTVAQIRRQSEASQNAMREAVHTPNDKIAN